MRRQSAAVGAVRAPDRIIERMVRRIVRRFDPEQVILFGSHARGEATRDSDVDLIVVTPVSGSKRERGLEIRSALRDIVVPKDVLVVTPEEMERQRDIVGTLAHIAKREGKVLYARP